MSSYRLTDWLPTTKKEIELRGWDYLDVILFSGDAYVDHPSFGAAVIGRILEAEGLRVAIVPQPDWRGDFRDFTKLGMPRLFFGVSPGAMDSMVNHYTANKRLRSDDAYTPDKRAGMRPDYPSIVYTKILKELYPDIPVILGGIEASMRRLAHYDYWENRLRPSILNDSPADLLIYGMGEKPIRQVAQSLIKGIPLHQLKDIPQTVFLTNEKMEVDNSINLFSYEECLKDKCKQAQNFRIIEEESNKYNAVRLLQQTGNSTVVVNPPYPPLKEDELDKIYDLPYTRLPHPKYKGKIIPAYEMIKFSVTIHRGCFGGCSFCAISAHQGKFISSRSEKSICKEINMISKMPDFKGYISDLGGPSANMFKMTGIDKGKCIKCKKPSCVFPFICKNLSADHTPLLELYKCAIKIPGVKKIFIGSGIRYDLLLHRNQNEKYNNANKEYLNNLIKNHVSGRLKVAPEHTEESVLTIMRKPSFAQFKQFKLIFDRINKDNNLKLQLIPYFISSHPGCSDIDMAELAIKTKELNFQLDQIQDFTPTPMTLATEIFYTGLHPYNLVCIKSARTKIQKLNQRQFFFWYKPEYRSQIECYLKSIGRNDIILKLFKNRL